MSDASHDAAIITRFATVAHMRQLRMIVAARRASVALRHVMRRARAIERLMSQSVDRTSGVHNTTRRDARALRPTAQRARCAPNRRDARLSPRVM